MSLKSNLTWIGSSHVVSLILSVFSFAFVARHYGPVEYGKFVYASSVISMFSILAVFGQRHVLIRDLAQDSRHVGKALSTSIFLLSLSTSILFAVSILFKPLLKYNLWIFLLVWASAICSNLTSIFFAPLRAIEKMRFEGVIKIVGNVLYVSFVALLIYTFYSKSIIDVLITKMALSIGLLAVATWNVSKKFHFSPNSFVPDKKTLLHHLRSGSAMVMITVGVVIYHKIDSVMIGKMLGSHEVGLYGVAYRLFEVATTSIALMLGVFYPTLSRWRANPVLFINLFKKLMFWMIILGICAGTGGVFLGHIAIPLVFGPAYIGSVGAFRILAFVVGIGSLGSLFGLGFRVYHLEFQFAGITLGAGLLNFVMNLFAIPRYGIEGAAITTLITMLFVVLSSRTLSQRLFPKGEKFKNGIKRERILE